MFTLKPISRDSVDGALAKAERYRLLNEPSEAESICRDILEIEPQQTGEARISLILALTDQFPRRRSGLCQRDGGDGRPGIGLRSRLLRRDCVGAAREGIATTPAGPGPAGGFTSGSSRRWGYSRKPSAYGPQATTTLFCAGMPVFAFLERHKSLKPATEDVKEPILSE